MQMWRRQWKVQPGTLAITSAWAARQLPAPWNSSGISSSSMAAMAAAAHTAMMGMVAATGTAATVVSAMVCIRVRQRVMGLAVTAVLGHMAAATALAQLQQARAAQAMVSQALTMELITVGKVLKSCR